MCPRDENFFVGAIALAVAQSVSILTAVDSNEMIPPVPRDILKFLNSMTSKNGTDSPLTTSSTGPNDYDQTHTINDDDTWSRILDSAFWREFLPPSKPITHLETGCNVPYQRHKLPIAKWPTQDGTYLLPRASYLAKRGW